MKSTDEVLSRLRGVKKCGSGWTALCPSHDDHQPSLSVTPADNGGTVFKCFKDCKLADILLALGLEMGDIQPSAPNEPMAVYTYKRADGVPTVQVRRYPPKDFRQFRWEAGAWVPKLLPDTPRVLYRLPELQGQATVWIVEGEKDADRLARAGLAATTKAGGAVAWIAAYTKQLQSAGVKSAYLVPDNDEAGLKYMRGVEKALTLAGIAATIIPLPGVREKGDVSDWLITHTIDELRALTTAPRSAGPVWSPRTFEAFGFSSYRLAFPGNHLAFELTRLRRDRHELWGELTVRCDLAGVKTIDGILSSGDFNCSAIETRSRRAKHLAQLSGLTDGMDWEHWLQELVLKVLEAERKGEPAELLTDIAINPDLAGEFDLFGLTFPRRAPAIIFGDGGSAKSYLALSIAGQLAEQGEIVLYADWEASGQDHHIRLRRLWPSAPPPILYAHCERPLTIECDRLRAIVLEHGITYMVCDSAAYGCAGAPESAEAAIAYFLALKSLGPIGALIVAHVTKAEDGDKHPFGSKFWHNSARATWNIKRSNPDDIDAPLDVQCIHRKANDARLKKPVYLQVTFTEDETRIARAHSSRVINERPEFGRDITVLDRIKAAVHDRPLTRDALIAAIPDTTPDTLKRKLRSGLEKGILVSFQHTDGQEVIGIRHRA